MDYRTGIFNLVCRYLSPKSVWIALKYVGDGLRPLHLIFTIVFTIGAMAIRPAVLSPGKAFTVQLEALRILARASFSFAGLA